MNNGARLGLFLALFIAFPLLVEGKARADLVAGALDKGHHREPLGREAAFAACATAFNRAQARIRVPNVEVEQSTDEPGQAQLSLDRGGGDMCLSGSDYRLTLRRTTTTGRSGWPVIDSAEDEGIHRRRYTRRMGRVEAIIETLFYDGEDLSADLVPILRAAAVSCARTINAGDAAIGNVSEGNIDHR